MSEKVCPLFAIVTDVALSLNVYYLSLAGNEVHSVMVSALKSSGGVFMLGRWLIIANEPSVI